MMSDGMTGVCVMCDVMTGVCVMSDGMTGVCLTDFLFNDFNFCTSNMCEPITDNLYM